MKTKMRLGLGAMFTLVAVLAAGCQHGCSTTAPHPRESAQGHPAQPTPSGPVAQPAPSAPAGQVWDAAGISIERLPGNSIRVHGVDRWGVSFDTTYADVTYFANAVPVVVRSLSDAQAQALVALVPEVRTAVAAP